MKINEIPSAQPREAGELAVEAEGLAVKILVQLLEQGAVATPLGCAQPREAKTSEKTMKINEFQQEINENQ